MKRVICFYTPRNEVRGVYWNHPVRPSVSRRARLGKIVRLGKMVLDTKLGEFELVATGGILSH